MRIAICDDDEKYRQHCRDMLEKLAEIHHVDVELHCYERGEELLFHIEDAKRYPDIIYLDMNMDGMSGDVVAQKLRELNFNGEIVYCTVSKAYYSSAFDVHALHYVVKGETSDSKFEEIFLRAVKIVRDKNTEYILCSGAGEYRNLAIRDIRYFQVVKRIITVYYGEDEEFSFYSTIGKIENRLGPYGFIRIHRAYLVSLAHIRTISYQEVTLKDGTVLPVGRSCYQELKRAMDRHASKI